MSSPCALEPAPNTTKYGVRLCPICHQPLQSLGAGNTIKSLWNRLPEFFLYPANQFTLGYLAVIALCNLAGAVHPATLELISLISMAAIFGYGFSCLKHTAKGNPRPPDFKIIHEASRSAKSLRQLGVFLLMAAALMFCLKLGGAVFGVVLLLLLACLPGSTMILAIEGDMLSAVKPVKLISMIQSIGKSYWIFYAFLLILVGGVNGLPLWLGDEMPTEALLSLQMFLTGYFSVFMFAMMGFLIHQHHEELGVAVVKEFSQDYLAMTPGLSDDPLLNTINILIKEGMFCEALKRLKPKLTNGGDINLHELYHKLLVLTGNKKQSNEHGQVYIRRILGQESKSRNSKLHEALQVYVNCLKLDNHFYLQEPRSVIDMAKAAKQFEMHNLAISMLKRFHEKFPDNPLIPEAYFTLARLLIEQNHKPEDAKKLLRFVIKRYPEHELRQQIKDYLDRLRSISGSATPSSVGGA